MYFIIVTAALRHVKTEREALRVHTSGDRIAKQFDNSNRHYATQARAEYKLATSVNSLCQFLAPKKHRSGPYSMIQDPTVHGRGPEHPGVNRII